MPFFLDFFFPPSFFFFFAYRISEIWLLKTMFLSNMIVVVVVVVIVIVIRGTVRDIALVLVQSNAVADVDTEGSPCGQRVMGKGK